mgnify:CR=1 FL=1
MIVDQEGSQEQVPFSSECSTTCTPPTTCNTAIAISGAYNDMKSGFDDVIKKPFLSTMESAVDKLYGVEGKILKHKGLFLYAVGLVFEHPISGEKINLKMNLPEKYEGYIEREKARWKKHNPC